MNGAGNPFAGSRDELVVSISADGWNFDQTCLVRCEPTERESSMRSNTEREVVVACVSWFSFRGELKRVQLRVFQLKLQAYRFTSQLTNIRTGLPRDDSVVLIAIQQVAVAHREA